MAEKFSKIFTITDRDNSYYSYASRYNSNVPILDEWITLHLWGEPNEPGIQSHAYIFMQYVDSYIASLVKVFNALALKRL